MSNLISKTIAVLCIAFTVSGCAKIYNQALLQDINVVDNQIAAEWRLHSQNPGDLFCTEKIGAVKTDVKMVKMNFDFLRDKNTVVISTPTGIMAQGDTALGRTTVFMSNQKDVTATIYPDKAVHGESQQTRVLTECAPEKIHALNKIKNKLVQSII